MSCTLDSAQKSSARDEPDPLPSSFPYHVFEEGQFTWVSRSLPTIPGSILLLYPWWGEYVSEGLLKGFVGISGPPEPRSRPPQRDDLIASLPAPSTDHTPPCSPSLTLTRQDPHLLTIHDGAPHLQCGRCHLLIRVPAFLEDTFHETSSRRRRTLFSSWGRGTGGAECYLSLPPIPRLPFFTGPNF